MTNVWITRTQPGARFTAARVEALGLDVLIAPLLRVESLDPDPLPRGWNVAFTSANGVRHFKGDTDATAWCVGAATAEAARQAGLTKVRTGPGDVAGLAAMMASELRAPVLHWSGAHVRGDLVGELNREGHEARRLVAYRTVAVEACPVESADIVLLHSRRAAQTYAQVCAGRARVSVSISAQTDAVLATQAGLARYIAEDPDEESLLKALRMAMERLEHSQ